MAYGASSCATLTSTFSAHSATIATRYGRGLSQSRQSSRQGIVLIRVVTTSLGSSCASRTARETTTTSTRSLKSVTRRKTQSAASEDRCGIPALETIHSVKRMLAVCGVALQEIACAGNQTFFEQTLICGDCIVGKTYDPTQKRCVCNTGFYESRPDICT